MSHKPAPKKEPGPWNSGIPAPKEEPAAGTSGDPTPPSSPLCGGGRSTVVSPSLAGRGFAASARRGWWGRLVTVSIEGLGRPPVSPLTPLAGQWSSGWRRSVVGSPRRSSKPQTSSVGVVTSTGSMPETGTTGRRGRRGEGGKWRLYFYNI